MRLACFIDYEKAFNRVNHTQQANGLDQAAEMDWNDERLILNLYWNHLSGPNPNINV